MAEVSGKGGAEVMVATSVPLLALFGWFKEGKSSSQRHAHLMRSSLDVDEFMNLLHCSDPVKVEFNRLENEVRDKDKELSEAQADIEALRLFERLRAKVVEEDIEAAVKIEFLPQRYLQVQSHIPTSLDHRTSGKTDV